MLTDTLIRLSVGIEATEDIIETLTRRYIHKAKKSLN